jgi:hypothetical protein
MIKCAECKCDPLTCTDKDTSRCVDCTKNICCCIDVHKNNNQTEKTRLIRFFSNVKSLYATALGIEILCIAAAEIGENSSFALFGYRTVTGVVLGYMFGYSSSSEMCSCCSVLEQDSSKGFLTSLLVTFKNFGSGIKKISRLYKQPNLKCILKTSLVILVTAESACILTAETVDLLLYKHSMILSIPIALLAGAFAVVVPEAYKKTRKERNEG